MSEQNNKIEFDPITTSEFKEQVAIAMSSFLIWTNHYIEENKEFPSLQMIFEKGFFYGGMAVLINEDVKETFENMIEQSHYQIKTSTL